jgi:hypothetical protein
LRNWLLLSRLLKGPLSWLFCWLLLRHPLLGNLLLGNLLLGGLLLGNLLLGNLLLELLRQLLGCGLP